MTLKINNMSEKIIEKLEKEIQDLRDEVSNLEGQIEGLYVEIESGVNEIYELEEENHNLRQRASFIGVDNSKSRNFQTGTLNQFLCDRYGVNYYTPKEDLVKFVKEELA